MIVDLLEQELKKHPDTSASAQWAIELLASRRYKRYLRVTKGNKKKKNSGCRMFSAIFHTLSSFVSKICNAAHTNDTI
ncbi:MAG: hypothetical protein KAR45_12720 [Desulfobacteraceae bacterium]|nr:hypothetical protein [Desulfobacteraceae bacterium]